MLEEFNSLPKAKSCSGAYESPVTKVQELLSNSDAQKVLQSSDEEGIYVKLDKMLVQISALYLECSNKFSHTYFSHYDE